MFPLTVEWFGLPDERKRHNEQIEYGFKGSSNDQLRQTWLSTAAPFLQSLGLDIPTIYDPAANRYQLTFPFPCRFVAAEKRWLWAEGQIGWDEVLERWKGRGPMNALYVNELQRGYRQLHGSTAQRDWREIVA
jgi:ring-1,2-phenylacetyl-CoA epoxidase subunit PaaA